MRLAGKVAIITGAAGGIGEALARSFIKEGAKVMLTDIAEEKGAKLVAELGEKTGFMRHDVSVESEWKTVIAATEEQFGPVSVLVNNAGINDVNCIENVEIEDFRRVIEINQISVLMGMKSVISSMRKAGVGSIINVASLAGAKGVRNAIGYSASKWAVRGLTKSGAVELAKDNIRVNCLLPGTIETAMHWKASEELRNATKALTPLNRVGLPEELAGTVLMLASDESLYTTGADFIVDGGLSC